MSTLLPDILGFYFKTILEDDFVLLIPNDTFLGKVNSDGHDYRTNERN